VFTVSAKNRTVFPKSNQPGRKDLEAAVKNAGYWKEVLSFDVVKLAEAYDDKRLPADLQEKLKTSRPARNRTDPDLCQWTSFLNFSLNFRLGNFCCPF